MERDIELFAEFDLPGQMTPDQGATIMADTSTIRQRWSLPLTLILILAALIAVPASATSHGDPGDPSGSGVQPVFLEGNLSDPCPAGSFELRVEPVADGTYSAGSFSVTIDVYNTPDGQQFDFSASGGAVGDVYVKGGPDTNWYEYDPLTTSDTMLHSPVNPSNGKYYGLSHISFCYVPTGSLEVQKFIDIDGDGILDTDPNDIDTAAEDTLGDLSGWTFELYAAGQTPGVDTPLDSKTTGADGTVTFDDLAPGTYIVYEANEGMVIGTYDVTSYATTSNPSGGYAVTAGNTTEVTFGNACLIQKEFEVNGVPAGTTGLYAWYDETPESPNVTTDDVQVFLSQEGTSSTWSAFAVDTFVVGDSLLWGYGVGSERVTIGTETFGVGDSYPDCRKTNSTDFDDSDITAYKYKDANDNGVFDDGTDIPYEGWDITITGPGLPAAGITLQTGADGSVNFPNLAPGTYTLTEGTVANWVQTYPAAPGTHSVTVGIDDSETVRFLNTPLSELRVGFTDLTGSTDVEIVCKDAEDNVIASLSYDSEGEVDEEIDLSDDSIRIGDSIVTCTFEITDP